MKKLLIFSSFLFFILFLPTLCISQTISINITEDVIGIVPTLTWGSNLMRIFDDASLYDGLQRSGTTLSRMDMNLDHIFPTNTSPPNFDSLDKMINATKSIGIEPVVIVDYTPKWLSKNTSSTMYPPTNITRYNELVGIVVNHIKNNATYYEIWNEPHNTNFWNGTEVEYRNLLRNVSQVIRSIDSDAKILVPSSGISSTSLFVGKGYEILQEVCKNANDYFDFVSFHIYVFPPDKWYTKMDDFKQNLTGLNCNKRLWNTESGIPPTRTTWDNEDVLQVAKSRKVLLDYDVDAQVYHPFNVYENPSGLWEGLYNSTEKTFTPVGKYYQIASQLKFYGEKLNIISNIQNNVSEISFVAAKNPSNSIVVQLTNNFSMSKEVQVNFKSIKNVTVYESSSDQIFTSPSQLGRKLSFNLTLKPYSVYLIEAKQSSVKVLGRLMDSQNSPIQAMVSVDSRSTITDSNGNYNLELQPETETYDIQYSMSNFFIPNFWIRLLAINASSDMQDLVNRVTGYSSENKLSFIVNVTDNHIIQTYSPNKPKRVLINGTEITEVSSLSDLVNNRWFYNSVENKLYIKAPTSAIQPTSALLHTEGTRILDSSGNDFVPFGINLMSPLFPPDFIVDRPSIQPTPALLDKLKTLKVNLVRITIAKEPWANETGYKEYIDKWVNGLAGVGIRSYLDFHVPWYIGTGHSHTTSERFVWFYQMMTNSTRKQEVFDLYDDWIQRYSTDKYMIGIGIANEPVGWPSDYPFSVTESQLKAAWKNYVVEAVQHIHTKNPDLLVFVNGGGINWGGDLRPFMGNVPARGNVVYTLHHYPQYILRDGEAYPFTDNYAKDYQGGNLAVGYDHMKKYVNAIGLNILNDNVPLMIEEFGFSESDGFYTNWGQTFDDFYKLADSKNVGILEWQLARINDVFGVLGGSDWLSLTTVGQKWAENLNIYAA